ncbi:MAG: competence/damage-inducible protein A [Rhodospirillaceae bacterium]
MEPTQDRVVTACLIIIGNEILSGRTRDANLQFLAKRLGAIGIKLCEARIIPDIEAEIIATVNACRPRYDHVFTTGGIGPTHDDITAACVAAAFGLALEHHPEAVARLKRHYGPENINEARLRMAMVPTGAVLIDNPVSAAPGFSIGNVHVLAGVPLVMQAMVDGLLPRMRGGPVAVVRTVACEIGEGVLADGLAALAARFSTIEIGSYPYFRSGYFGVSLVLRGLCVAELLEATEAVCALVRALGGTPLVTEGSNGDNNGGAGP